MKATILSGIRVGPGQPVRVMGVINVSPESFYPGSVAASERALATRAIAMEKAGADFLDVGALSTAPYLKTQISEMEEAKRLARAVRVLKRACDLPLSADTSRAGPAEAALENGAALINDVTGLHNDPRLASVAKRAAGVILMAHPSALRSASRASPILAVKAILRRAIARARRAGIEERRIVVDPGIGFFRRAPMAWWRWDLSVLRDLGELKSLGIPTLIGVSRKSFIGKILDGIPADERLAGSLAATVIAVTNGASMVRTHDVRETVETLRVIRAVHRT